MKVLLWLAAAFFVAAFALVAVLYLLGMARKGGMTILFLPCIGGLLIAIGNLGRSSITHTQGLLMAVWVALVAIGIPLLYRDDAKSRRQ